MLTENITDSTSFLIVTHKNQQVTKFNTIFKIHNVVTCLKKINHQITRLYLSLTSI